MYLSGNCLIRIYQIDVIFSQISLDLFNPKTIPFNHIFKNDNEKDFRLGFKKI